MTHFLAWMLTLLQICLTPTKAILSPPKNLTVQLLDFKATAEWLPGQGNPPGTRYTMEFITAQKMYGGKWNRSAHCTDVAVLKCKITFDWQPNELHWNYFVRVQATFKGTSSNWTTTSKSFQPYGDTRLSSPDVKISTEQKSIKINFSHWLELKPEIKPLEYVLYLFENSPTGESKFVALVSSSESPYIFHDVPSGKNYCVSVSASHQQVLKNNNFNTTRCVFLLDSTKSFVLLICIVAMLLIAFSTAIVFLCGCFYHMQLINQNHRMPEPLIVIPQPIWVLKPIPVVPQPIMVAHPKTEMNPEDYCSSSEEDSKDGYLFYHPRENLTFIVRVDPPKQAEEAKTSNQCFKYKLAKDMEDSDKSVISKKDDGNMHSLSESGSFCAINHSGSSKTLQTVTVNMSVSSEIDRYCEEETLCSSGSDFERVFADDEEEVEEEVGEEEDDFFLLDSSESGYEPRHLYL